MSQKGKQRESCYITGCSHDKAIYVRFTLCTHQCLLIERYALCVRDGSGHTEIHYRYFMYIFGEVIYLIF